MARAHVRGGCGSSTWNYMHLAALAAYTGCTGHGVVVTTSGGGGWAVAALSYWLIRPRVAL